MKLEIKPYTLDFKFSARTSRGKLAERKVWFIRVSEGVASGIGEVAPIARLSPEDPDDVVDVLERIKEKLIHQKRPASEEAVYELVSSVVDEGFPSIRFGLEMALLDLLGGGSKYPLAKQLAGIDVPINGLVWMGDEAFMQEQIKEKLDAGFQCIKLKIGALDFDAELSIIKELRSFSEELVIRLDANGAFQTNEVLMKLKALSKYNIHSVEQPIMPLQPEAMELVCNRGEIPIALDEELIGIYRSRDKVDLIQEVRPQYLVLKPTLHGGLSSVKEWIDLAEMHGVGWWITSYLESNIGLNAIAQLASLYPKNPEYHGLGTGGLYHNNITSPIVIERGKLTYAKSEIWGDIDF